jgi:hypothetical protein
MGLSFTIVAGLRQRSHSQVGVPRDSWPHFTASDSKLPKPGGPSLRIEFEVFTPVVMKSSICWDITPCSPFKVRFGETCRLSLQCRRINQEKKPECNEVASTALFILRRWRWRRHIPPKLRFTLNRLHGVTSQMIQLLAYNNCFSRQQWILSMFLDLSVLNRTCNGPDRV